MITLLALLAAGALDPASAAIAATLPAHLALVEASIPARIAEQAAAPDAKVVVEWRTPPRAGAARVSITTWSEASSARPSVQASSARPSERASSARPSERASSARPSERASSARPSVQASSARPSVRAWVPVVLAAQAERPTAARALPAGHLIGEDDLVLEMIPGSRDPLAMALVVGATVRTAVKAGDELTADVLALAPPLPRGTPLTVIAQLGSLRVTRAGRLEAPARVGEVAKIRLDDTARLARARLDSPTTALLETTR